LSAFLSLFEGALRAELPDTVDVAVVWNDISEIYADRVGLLK
jgi:hypothetical protein